MTLFFGKDSGAEFEERRRRVEIVVAERRVDRVGERFLLAEMWWGGWALCGRCFIVADMVEAWMR